MPKFKDNIIELRDPINHKRFDLKVGKTFKVKGIVQIANVEERNEKL